MDRQYASNARALALEAGETMHQVFAAVRIWQLEHIQNLPKHAKAVATRIFGLDRWAAACSEAATATESRDQLLQLGFAILHSSGYYDDPSDNIRTISNMEMATICYVDERLPGLESWPIWVADKRRPAAPVGIEQHFDVVLAYEDGKLIRFIGTVDGLVLNTYRDNRLTLDENKTASRLDDAWRAAFEIGHQLTGYMASCIAIFGQEVYHARVTGLKIRPTQRGEDIIIETPSREPHHFIEWAKWVRHTVQMHELYAPDFELAPRYTHSCNRYFRPCSLIPFCSDTPEGRQDQYESMQPAVPTPSERAIQG